MYIPSKKFAVMLGFCGQFPPPPCRGAVSSCLLLLFKLTSRHGLPLKKLMLIVISSAPPLIIKDLILIGQLICLFIQTTLGITIFAIFSPSVLEGTSVKQINNRPSPRRRQESIYFLNVSLLLCNLHVQDLDNPRHRGLKNKSIRPSPIQLFNPLFNRLNSFKTFSLSFID